MSSSDAHRAVGTSENIVSLAGFYAIQWVIVFICTLMCAGRVYIRYVCFHRLELDDWLMVLAWGLIVAIAALGQVYLKGCYMLMAVSRGDVSAIGPNFLDDAHDALRGFGVAMVFCYVGIWTVKLNYLLFFRRLGAQHAAYTKLWWVVLVITIGCGGVFLGLFPYNCLFYSMTYIMGECTQRSTISRIYTFWKVSTIVDVISDVLIILFPVIVLWRVRIPTQTKLALIGIFSLVGFTIGVTIVRGSVFGGTYKSIKDQKNMELNMTWLWFWFFIEYSVSFIVACLASFRGLFVHNRKKDKQRLLPHSNSPQSPNASPSRGSYLKQKAKRLHDSLLQTFKDTETVRDGGLPHPATGNFSASFIEEIQERHDPARKSHSVVAMSMDDRKSSTTTV